MVTTAVKQVFLDLLFFLSPGRSEGGYKHCRHEKSPSKFNEVISPEVLKMRAALFCIFTYLDTKTLLRAAEVCRDWKFVARHPAVWTRVLLENARISSKVFNTIHTNVLTVVLLLHLGTGPPTFIRSLAYRIYFLFIFFVAISENSSIKISKPWAKPINQLWQHYSIII